MTEQTGLSNKPTEPSGPPPWERKWNDVKEVASKIVGVISDSTQKVVEGAKKPWELSWGGSMPTPTKAAPVASVHPTAPSRSSYLSKLAEVESGGNTNAAASTSSAVGLYQFTKGTWEDTTKKMGVSYSLADRTDPVKSRAVVEAFTAKNERTATRDLGRAPANHELYMYHLLGSAKDLLTASPTEPAIDFVQPRQAKANKNIFYTKTGEPKTVREVLETFKRKFQ